VDVNTLQSVLDISRQMAQTRKLEPLLQYAMAEAARLVGAERGYLVLARPDGSLDYRVKYSRDGSVPSEDQISMSILADAARTGQPLVVRDAVDDPKFATAKSVVALQLRSVMCVPLITRGEVIGAIYVENRSIKARFKDDDVTPLVLFANQAAVAIDNAALNDELERRIDERTRELSQARSDLEQSWMEAVEANRLRTVLLGNISHDLRTPLSITIGALLMIKDGDMGDLNPEQVEWIGKAYDAANNALKLTNDIFDMAKLEMGGLRLVVEPVNLNDFLNGIHTVAQGLRWTPGLQFVFDVEPDLPVIEADPGRIQQVILNLLSNALKFTKQGNITLYARHIPEHQHVMIGVMDTGEGIPEDKIDKLFQRFQQIDKNNERLRLSTGLGLAICRDLIEMHHGTIWAENNPDGGSNFKFVLPVSHNTGHNAN
jgi:signal transduction histidine kinase